MKLKKDDFILTDEQLLEINLKFIALVDTRSEPVVNPYHVVQVTFEFSSLGKLISAHSQLCFDEEEAFYTDVKPFTHSDISLTENQFLEINDHFTRGLSAVVARKGVYSDLSSKVTFESLSLWVNFQFGPGWRSLDASFGDGQEMGDVCYKFLPEIWNNSSAGFPGD